MYATALWITPEAFPTGSLLRIWLSRAAVVCAVALSLTQPVASVAWLMGGHATIEHVVLHKSAMEHGHADHHGSYAAGDVHAAGAAAPARHGGTELDPAGLSLELSAAAALASPYQDAFQGTLVESLNLVTIPRTRSLNSSVEIPLRQHFPPVPHRPPITY